LEVIRVPDAVQRHKRVLRASSTRYGVASQIRDPRSSDAVWTPDQQRITIASWDVCIIGAALHPGNAGQYQSQVSLVNKRRGFRHTRPRGAIAVDTVIAIGVTKRYSAYHPPVIAELEMMPDQTGLMR
jgi:hypothetical protein